MVDAELVREQKHVAGLYARLDELKARAERQLADIRGQDVGGNHQHRSERDAFAQLYEDRILQLRDVNDRLAFGRLELIADAALAHAGGTGAAEPDTAADALANPRFRYVGRIGLRDEQQNSMLLDWRAPQASAFYQATAATPLGARARRHLTTKGREVVRFEDEIFDAALFDDDTHDLQGEAALMAAISAQRTGRMHDIVATIQAEQDRIIRSELKGTLVVQGGPGTGKTAVALHRAAYLLYSHRTQLANSGVLVVGPSRSFLQYIEQVLPSLGETGVVLSTVGQLYPGVDATRDDAPEVAVLKGSARMADVIRRGVRSRRRVPENPATLTIDGETLTLDPRTIESAMARAVQTRKPHNLARVTFVKSALGQLTRQLAEQLRSGGSTVDDADEAVLREDLRTSHDVRVALNTAWMPLTPEKFVEDLFARPQWFAELTPDWTPAERARLRRDRGSEFTVSDVALLDEAAELLGEFNDRSAAREREEKLQRKRDIENAEQAIVNMGVQGLVDAEDLAAGFAETADRGTTAERAAADRGWTYGHIVVDEAQELSHMQWRALIRRSPMKSFTIVGDVAQSGSLAGATTWHSALDPLFGDRWRLEELTVNYRTPRQVADAAERMALDRNLPITQSRTVREGAWPVSVTEVEAGVLSATLDATLDAVNSDRGIDSNGTLAVIVPESLIDAVFAHLATTLGDKIDVGARGLTKPMAVLTPHDSKGLEFDSVIVVDTDRILAEEARGAAALYVAMTRPTQRLHLIQEKS